MNRILRELCEASLFIDSHEHLLTSKDLSRLTGIDRKEVLKELKSLKASGLIVYVRTIEHSSEDEPWFFQGWAVTRKASNAPEFEAALDTETAWFIHAWEEDTEADPWEYAKTFMSTRRFLDWRRTT